ncbi:MAG TPA: hypothetical protein VHS52_05165 [Acidimicrobiales bacterium]|jgi:hypothetical protein|nr:hypothetical protein [Acidimicrobiales bacterium]
MRLSELLHCHVIDAGGASLGSVVDVLAVWDGPPSDGSDATLRIAGLVVGRRGIGVRLGFHRARMTGPWPLASLLDRLERRSSYVEWEKVTSRDADTIRVSARRSDLRPPPPLPR